MISLPKWQEISQKSRDFCSLRTPWHCMEQASRLFFRWYKYLYRGERIPAGVGVTSSPSGLCAVASPPLNGRPAELLTAHIFSHMYSQATYLDMQLSPDCFHLRGERFLCHPPTSPKTAMKKSGSCELVTSLESPQSAATHGIFLIDVLSSTEIALCKHSFNFWYVKLLSTLPFSPSLQHWVQYNFSVNLKSPGYTKLLHEIQLQTQWN